MIGIADAQLQAAQKQAILVRDVRGSTRHANENTVLDLRTIPDRVAVAIESDIESLDQQPNSATGRCQGCQRPLLR
jgi:hypothetical protein